MARMFFSLSFHLLFQNKKTFPKRGVDFILCMLRSYERHFPLLLVLPVLWLFLYLVSALKRLQFWGKKKKQQPNKKTHSPCWSGKVKQDNKNHSKNYDYGCNRNYSKSSFQIPGNMPVLDNGFGYIWVDRMLPKNVLFPQKISSQVFVAALVCHFLQALWFLRQMDSRQIFWEVYLQVTGYSQLFKSSPVLCGRKQGNGRARALVCFPGC